MKKMAVLCILVFAFMALVSCAGPDKVYRARATVAEYQAGKFIKVPSDLPTVIMQGTNTVRNPDYVEFYTCDITPQTEVKGDIKPGTRVILEYKLLGPRGPGYVCKATMIDRIWE